MLNFGILFCILLALSGCGEESGSSSSASNSKLNSKSTPAPAGIDKKGAPGAPGDAIQKAVPGDPGSAAEGAVEVAQEENSVLCLDDCSAQEKSSLSWKTVPYFKAPTSNCKLAESWTFLSRQNNSISVLFRANYASAGLWQLYMRKITLDEQGNWTPEQTAVNIFPECLGKQDGVQAVQIMGIEQVGRLAFVVPAGDMGDRVTTVRIKATCASGIKLSEKTLDLASGLAVSTPVVALANGLQYVAEAGPTNLHLSKSGKAFDNAGNEISVNLGKLAGKVSWILGQDSTGGTYLQMPTEYSLREGYSWYSSEYCDPTSTRFDSGYCTARSNLQYLPAGGDPVRLTGTPPQAGINGYLVHPTQGLIWADSNTVLRWVGGRLYTASDSEFDLNSSKKLTRLGDDIFQFINNYSGMTVYKTDLRAGVNTSLGSLSGSNLFFSGWYDDRIVVSSSASQNSPDSNGVVMISSAIEQE